MDDGERIPEPVPFAFERHAERLGPYRLLQLLGKGGMGEVWLAEQLEPLRRQVAVKFLRLEMETREFVARFEAERQMLALMDHPNIASIYEAGVTPTGRPYFVMELVRGSPITDYCDGQRLATRERLRMFGDVCAAVQHAHQKGIIHRDLKPSNVLVTSTGGGPVVKIIDFGIAKAVAGQWLTDKTLRTLVGQKLGTPAYMSPVSVRRSGQPLSVGHSGFGCWSRCGTSATSRDSTGVRGNAPCGWKAKSRRQCRAQHRCVTVTA